MDKQPFEPLLINGRHYRAPTRPVVVICFDGCDPAYLQQARGRIPALTRMMTSGFYGLAKAAMPTFTNPNNIAIVCGAPPSVTGVAGNYYLDRNTGREIMVVDGHQMKAETILARFAASSQRVAIVTAKNKLLKALANGHAGIACSAENYEAALEAVGPVDPERSKAPDKYSAELSLFVLDAGVALVERQAADILYLSLSDFVQHKHAPDEPEAIAFMEAVDQRIGRLINAGAVVGIVADHGMTDMANADGSARIVFVEDEIAAAFGDGAARVICPITDPFTRHHASLGGFVRVYVRRPDIDIDAVRAFLSGLPGVELALTGAEACARFELPLEGEADIALVAAPGVALGARAAEHDLSQLAGQRLRSHGGLSEQSVPFLVSHKLSADYAARADEGLRNFDIFDFVINGVEP